MKTFNEFILGTAQLLDSIAAKHEVREYVEKEIFNEYCASSSGPGILFELEHAEDYRQHCARHGLPMLPEGVELSNKQEVAIAQEILKCSDRFYAARIKPLTAVGIRAIQEALVKAVKVDRPKWLVEQLELAA